MNNHDAQPSPAQAYETAGNPTDKSASEQSMAQLNSKTDADNAVAHREANEPHLSDDQATKTSRARGIHGAPPGEEVHGYTQEQLDTQELTAAQMGAPGEDKVIDAVNRKPGATGGEQGLETDLDKKKQEQSAAREKVQKEEQHEVDVAGVLGQRGGPANPVDKGGYPNGGS
ncbi:unnamed protein product [Zymoseptoria tritici ST99CH_3D1]|uniref:Uncharacterized protein n=3 Tax=Zymoseptoria tritici TaxID=1047171 RepID=F9WWP9_ZYMTI|nr:uncharacterized protein MYCGRDRAFT_102682 [Zymoseptoria tritici IPO323]EGP92155.1 hypothetical protein MYCGRDRAFT_102682 [Zymoseptoria tritici IPO323]SMQ46304.1 unnamed protein product [Zymoseptoria tritici ST99CH_3D7]SMR42649.1 unnamed protein product [Zymoseptoria tritici ST99CH_1E4]SMR44825.1 unnamed protein product [Zymoseptoria tritici ST99CH_3D1]